MAKLGSIVSFSFNEFSIHTAGLLEVPAHTQESLQNYLLYGYPPGGFVSAMLANDLFRAIAVADVANKQAMWAIGYWITTCGPAQARGSYERVEDWCNDTNGCRTAYAEPLLKQHTLDVLRA